MSDTSQILARLAGIVAADANSPLTHRLCEGCRDLMGADAAAIVVDFGRSNRITVWATDQAAADLEDLQDVTGQGPSIDAHASGAPVTSTLGADAIARWPVFMQQAPTMAGITTVYAVPMRPGGRPVGVVSMLRHRPGSLTEDLFTAQFLADAIGAALIDDPLATAPLGQAGTWSERAEIDQATGMVLAQLRLSADDALALLKAHAYAHGLRLSAVARQVIARTLDFRTS
jgi:hypothetical protein